MSVLSIINEELDSIGVPYEFMRWTSGVTDEYWVGEYSEDPITTEDGYKASTVILTGTINTIDGTWLQLERTRAKIEKHFHPVCGLSKATDNGSVVIFYENSFPIPTGEANLKRIQINLQVKEWRDI
jgi:hypothetical protein